MGGLRTLVLLESFKEKFNATALPQGLSSQHGERAVPWTGHGERAVAWTGHGDRAAPWPESFLGGYSEESKE